MNALTDRRAVLAILPAAAFLSSWAQASGAEADAVGLAIGR
jgi:hypothetical protein